MTLEKSNTVDEEISAKIINISERNNHKKNKQNYWKEKKDADRGKEPEIDPNAPFADDKIVFIHQDFTVTESMWQGENVIFNSVTPEWKEFCAGALAFKVPDDLDLIVANEATA